MFPVMLPPLLLTLRVLRSSAEVLGSLGLPANTIPSKHVTNITASLMIEQSKKNERNVKDKGLNGYNDNVNVARKCRREKWKKRKKEVVVGGGEEREKEVGKKKRRRNRRRRRNRGQK